MYFSITFYVGDRQQCRCSIAVFIYVPKSLYFKVYFNRLRWECIFEAQASLNIWPTVSRFYDIVGFILAFGSLFFQPIPKGRSIKKNFGHLFSWAFFWFLFFTKNWEFIRKSLSLFSNICYDLMLWLSFWTCRKSEIFISLM